VLISAYSLAAAASAWGLGRLSRSHAPQRLLLATLVGGALIVAPMALVPSFELMLALAVLLGLVGGGSLTLCYTIGGPDGAGARSAPRRSASSRARRSSAARSPPPSRASSRRRRSRGIYFVDAALYVLLALALVRRGALQRPARV
jgi:MFS family permease